MSTSNEILELVGKTPFVDTHEHLAEESTRLQDPSPSSYPTDFSVLLTHYADSDLIVAGMTPADHQKLVGAEMEPADKWKLVAPFYDRSRHTGYIQNVRESVRMLYGEDDLSAETVETVSEKLAAMIKPGYYRHVLKEVSHLEHCQVNSLETGLFMETEQPELLCQDLSFVRLSTRPDVQGIAPSAGIEVNALEDWHQVIDWCFATYGPRAIAVKNQSAYERKLDYEQVSAEAAAPLFARFLKDANSLTGAELKAVQDHLFHYCIDKATEYKLPVKLHSGYYAGYGGMPLHRLRHNAGDLCALLAAHPHTPFVIMHITYPYQDEAIAIAKHYPNAYVDLCWAWIINPLAGVRFVKEFLMAAPANKLFTFGGDYLPVEMVPGHARIARRGLAQALSELVEEGWVAAAAVPALVERLMRGNAHELFDYKGTLAAWK
jgi:predicted TIM-barrel fold metal-dependent hydrolase